MPLQNLIAIPDAIGFVEAAAFPLTFLTAWHMLVTRAKVRPGEDVLVLGAGSGVGQAAIQIAWLHGARVFATAGTDEKLAQGARDRRLRSRSTTTRRTRRRDPAAHQQARRRHRHRARRRRRPGSAASSAWRDGGRLVTCGATTGYDATIDLRFLFARQYTLMGSYMGTKAELLRAAQFFFSGQLRPVVDRTCSRSPRPPRRSAASRTASSSERSCWRCEHA